MTIETKYSTANIVWIVQENKVVSGKVKEIHIIVKNSTTVMYVVEGCGIPCDSKHKECNLYPTKETLIASL